LIHSFGHDILHRVEKAADEEPNMPRMLPCPFFKTWSPDMAYRLGYWFADGNMYSQWSCKSYVVSIGSKDVEHLEVLRGIIGVGKLTRITGSDVFKLVICRKEMYDDLLRLGGTERKSLTLAWPEVPVEYLAHFVRGYIDGDGSLTWHTPGNSVHPLISVVGTRAFLTGMAAATQEATGIPMPVCHFEKGSSNTWTVKWYGIRAKCLAIWLYQSNAGLGLARKQVLATAFAEWKPKVFDPTSTTPKMWKLFGKLLP
jgi:hypothetical protein